MIWGERTLFPHSFCSMAKILNILQLVGLALIGGLFVLVRLRDKELHRLKVEMLLTHFMSDDAEAERELARLRKEYEDAKATLDTASNK